MNLREHLVNGRRVERDGDVCRLIIPPTTSAGYVDAQLDDYDHALPRTFTNQPPQHLRIRARFSHPASALKGTAGLDVCQDRQDGELIAGKNFLAKKSSL